jgi:hypothetical protein
VLKAVATAKNTPEAKSRPGIGFRELGVFRGDPIMGKPLVLITGASQGIGAAIARVFAGEVPGVRLALVARQEAKLAAVARACRRAGAGAAECFPTDVTDAAAVTALERAVRRSFGVVDVLIGLWLPTYGAPFSSPGPWCRR